jgi:hypothetical protein
MIWNTYKSATFYPWFGFASPIISPIICLRFIDADPWLARNPPNNCPRNTNILSVRQFMNIVVELIILVYTEENLSFLSQVTGEKIYEMYWHGYMKEATETSLRYRPHAAIFWGRVRHDLWPIRLRRFSVHFPKLFQYPVISSEQKPQLRNATEKFRV